MRIIWMVAFCLVSMLALAKNKPKNCCANLLLQNNWQLSIFNAGIGMPPHVVNGRIHPGINIGMLHAIGKKQKWDYHLHAGAFTQQALQNAMYLKPGLGRTFNLYKKIQLRPSLNCSVMMIHLSNDEFTYDNGQYDAVNKNHLQCMPSVGLETTIPIFNCKKVNYKLLLRYEFGTQLPFSMLSSILPINQIHVGVQLHPIHK